MQTERYLAFKQAPHGVEAAHGKRLKKLRGGQGY